MRLTLSYWAIFALVVVAFGAGAYVIEEGVYRDALAPVLGTPEGQAALARAMSRVAYAILLVATPLLAVVAAASYLLARASIAPLQAAAQREREFAADIAHEIRTPLATIASVAQAALPDGNVAERAAFETIAAAALDASRLVGDLALLARAGGPEKLERETIDLRDTVTRVAREYANRNPSPRFEVEAESVFAEADERRIAQVVRNLLDNAARHAQNGVHVLLRAEGRYAAIVVDDDGPGVPEELRNRVFERLVRAGDGGGSGLGLAICRWVARAHGGDVVLEDRARFVVRIPRLHP
ncbi:MAG: HAMP domain-containing histidine kinase [Candidatus Eremiobacteraeota bacterium]|nr:HAMP domain-containing histidine kinase [Candidatus Eremiobacteraeota bacterium]